MARRLACAALVWLACSQGSAPVPREGARVVALAPSLVALIRALGAEHLLVGVDEFSRGAPGNERWPSVGGLYGPDLERTLELEPTLVLAVRSAAHQSFLDRLRERGVRVEEFEVYTLDEVLASFARVGALVGREAQGRALAARVRDELDGVARSVAGLPRPRAVLVLERDPLYVAGGGAFTHALLEAAGAENAFADLAEPYPRVSLEALADRAPDLVIDTSGDAGDASAWWSRWPWVRRAVALERDAVTLPGPDLPAGARALVEVIHPERLASARRAPASQ
jgi:ABC-type Fe3+-hydroxamate transport system substrate-binding protein